VHPGGVEFLAIVREAMGTLQRVLDASCLQRGEGRARHRLGVTIENERAGSAGGRLDRPWFGTLPRDGEVFTFQGSTIADAQEVIALAGAGLIRNQVEEFSFEKVEEAYERLATGTLTGRAVVLP